MYGLSHVKMKKSYTLDDGVAFDRFRCSALLDWLLTANGHEEKGLNFVITLLSGSRLREL